MDYSQYLRLKQEAANIYIARNKTVDSSFLTLQKKQKAAYSGDTVLQTPPYYNGELVLSPRLYDVGSCPAKHAFTEGFSQTNRISQQEDHASRLAGAVMCSQPSYTDTPNIMRLKSCAEVSTILTSYNNNAFVPAIRPCVSPLPLPVTIPDMNSMFFNGNSFLQVTDDTGLGSGPGLIPIISSNFTIEFNIKIPSPGLSSTQVLFYIGQQGDYDKLIISLLPAGLVDKIRPEKNCCLSKDPEKVQGYTLGINFGSDIYSTGLGGLLPAKSPTVLRNSTIQTDIWYYFAIVRNGSTITVYKNGRVYGVLNDITDMVYDESANGGTGGYISNPGYYLQNELIIGGRYNPSNSSPPLTPYLTYGFNGYISNFRWTKQEALYTKDFIMPMPPFYIYNNRMRLLIIGNRSIRDDSAVAQVVHNSNGFSVNGNPGDFGYYNPVVNT